MTYLVSKRNLKRERELVNNKCNQEILLSHWKQDKSSTANKLSNLTIQVNPLLILRSMGNWRTQSRDSSLLNPRRESWFGIPRRQRRAASAGWLRDVPLISQNFCPCGSWLRGLLRLSEWQFHSHAPLPSWCLPHIFLQIANSIHGRLQRTKLQLRHSRITKQPHLFVVSYSIGSVWLYRVRPPVPDEEYTTFNILSGVGEIRFEADSSSEPDFDFDILYFR